MYKNSAVFGSAWVFFAGLTTAASIVIVPIATVGDVLPKIVILSITAGALLLWMLIFCVRKNFPPIKIEKKIGVVFSLYILTMFVSLLWSVAPMTSIFGSTPRFEGILFHSMLWSIGFIALILTQNTSGRMSICLTLLINNLIIILYAFLHMIGIHPIVSSWKGEDLWQFILLTLPFVVLNARLAEGGLRVALYGLCILNMIVLVSMGSQFLSQQSRPVASQAIIWQDALSMIKEKPQGWGLETMGFIFPRFQNDMRDETKNVSSGIIDRAKNKPIDLLITLGLPGLLTYYAFLALLLRYAWYVWKEEKSELAFAGIVSIIGFNISLLFGVESIITHVFFWIICGALLGLNTKKYKIKNTIYVIPIRPILIFFTILTLAGTMSSIRLFQARLLMNDAVQAFERGDIQTAVTTYRSASRQIFGWDREILVNTIETALLAREHADSEQQSIVLDQFINQEFDRLSTLTNNQDGMVPLFRAWKNAILFPKRTGTIESDINYARSLLPPSESVEMIVLHIYSILGYD
jgi:O-antigen ligase